MDFDIVTDLFRTSDWAIRHYKDYIYIHHAGCSNSGLAGKDVFAEAECWSCGTRVPDDIVTIFYLVGGADGPAEGG